MSICLKGGHDMLRNFGKFVLGLFGIEAIIRKGTSYIVLEEWGEIVADGTISASGFNAQNISMGRQADGQFAIRPIQNERPF
jgi:hypothetical protein